jgi:hypothetical protein
MEIPFSETVSCFGNRLLRDAKSLNVMRPEWLFTAHIDVDFALQSDRFLLARPMQLLS